MTRRLREGYRHGLLASDLMTALLSDMVTELEDLGGISAPRVQAILHGEAATYGELEEIGYVCVELIRALKQV